MMALCWTTARSSSLFQYFSICEFFPPSFLRAFKKQQYFISSTETCIIVYVHKWNIWYRTSDFLKSYSCMYKTDAVCNVGRRPS